jgi:predicted nucleic acid-binding protein
MSDGRNAIVINTAPLLALIAALGELEILKTLFSKVIVPNEVCLEICCESSKFGADVFAADTFITRVAQPVLNRNTLLWKVLDRGEASVIQTALDKGIQVVCIDETAGRRYARLHDLSLTGSCGILLAAKKKGLIDTVSGPLAKMRAHGIWISDMLLKKMLELSNET